MILFITGMKKNKKYIFLGDIDSINLEIICKSYLYIKNKVEYIILGNKNDILRYLDKINSKLELNFLNDPFDFTQVKNNNLNLFNIENISKIKYKNLLNQLGIANLICNKSGIDLVTMPIDKSIFKKKIKFNGITEYLSEINKRDTIMLLRGDKFSVVPLTTHINLKDVRYIIDNKKLKKIIGLLLREIKKKQYQLNFNIINFLCYNPHCSENRTLGEEDNIIKKNLNLFKEINGPISADSAFSKFSEKTLFISTYHDQVLIPFKALNSKMINMTLGLKYRRLSPAHGTAKDIKFKNLSNINSYVECMKI